MSKAKITSTEKTIREIIFSVAGTEYTRIYKDKRSFGHRTKIFEIASDITAVDIKKINRQTNKHGVSVSLITRPGHLHQRHSLVYNMQD